MPKVVDHVKYRAELAQRSAEIFAEFGYTGLGMRQIASKLGISKSALYHYFPSKEALFAACTEMVTNFEAQKNDSPALEHASIAEKITALMDIFKEQENGFQGEMSLLSDYMRGRSAEEIAQDKNMQLANERYLSLVSEFVGPKDAKAVLCLILGTLLQRLFDGRQTDLKEMEAWLVAALNSGAADSKNLPD